MAEERSGEGLQKGLQRDQSGWRMVGEEMNDGAREGADKHSDYGHGHNEPAKFESTFILTTKNICSQLGVDVVYVMVLWRRLSPRALRN